MLEGAFVVQDETLAQFSHLYRGLNLVATGPHVWSQIGRSCSNDLSPWSAALPYLHLLQNSGSTGYEMMIGTGRLCQSHASPYGVSLRASSDVSASIWH